MVSLANDIVMLGQKTFLACQLKLEKNRMSCTFITLFFSSPPANCIVDNPLWLGWALCLTLLNSSLEDPMTTQCTSQQQALLLLYSTLVYTT